MAKQNIDERSIHAIQNVSSSWNVHVNSLRPNDACMLRQCNHHWFNKWLVAWSAPSHHLNQCWKIVIWTQITNFNEILIEILTFSLKKMRLDMSSGKWRPFYLDINELRDSYVTLQSSRLLSSYYWVYSCVEMFEIQDAFIALLVEMHIL